MTCLQLSARTSTVLISCTYLVFHAAFLVINFILLADTESHLQQIAHAQYVRQCGHELFKLQIALFATRTSGASGALSLVPRFAQ